MITFKSVSKSYGNVRALRDLTMEIADGEVFGYVGPNGAGKTTTMRILSGLLTDYRGTVSIDGIDVRSTPIATNRIGYVPQESGFQEWRTVEHALHTFGLLSGIDSERLHGEIDRVLDQTGIREHRKRRISHLSGGTVQRLRLAQAILHDPQILVLDEPLSGLDPASRFQVKQIISELAKRNGRIVFISSHILGELEGLATTIGILLDGTIREAGTPAQLRTKYQVGTVIQLKTAAGFRTDWSVLADSAVARVETLGPGHVHLHVAPGVELDQAMHRVMGLVLQHHLPVRSVSHLQPSLEDVYLSLVREAHT